MVERPWERVKDPVQLPDLVEHEQVLALSDEEIAGIILSHLLPRSEDSAYRARWDRMWALVAANDVLAHRFLDVLEDFIAVTERAVESGLEPAQRKRALRYLKLWDDRWKALDGEADEPLKWAGPAVRKLPRPARRVLEKFVDAIDEHRGEVEESGVVRGEDERLWSVLESTGLEPRASRRDAS